MGWFDFSVCILTFQFYVWQTTIFADSHEQSSSALPRSDNLLILRHALYRFQEGNSLQSPSNQRCERYGRYLDLDTQVRFG